MKKQIRTLPRKQPDAKFYEAMRGQSAIGCNPNRPEAKADALTFADVPMLRKEFFHRHRFQADMEGRFLQPDKNKLK